MPVEAAREEELQDDADGAVAQTPARSAAVVTLTFICTSNGV